MQSKVLAKIEQIARWRVAGVKDSVIAQKLGMSYGGLVRILQTELYKKRETEVRHFLTGKMDQVLVEDRTSILKNELRDAVPDALKFIIDQCRQGSDMRARMAAAKEVLDRDPSKTFSKTGRAEDQSSNNPNGLPEGVLSAAKKESQAATRIMDTPIIPMKPGEA
jgi:hypothetical protein